jgi:hypothetical protein
VKPGSTQGIVYQAICIKSRRKGKMRKSILFALSLLVVVSLLIAACGPTPEPQVVEKVVTQQVPVEVTRVVVETQVVQGAPVEVTKIIKEEVTKEVVVTATPVRW